MLSRTIPKGLSVLIKKALCQMNIPLLNLELSFKAGLRWIFVFHGASRILWILFGLSKLKFDVPCRRTSETEGDVIEEQNDL